MAIISRQTGLLAAENWTKIYQTFRDADFTAYDFETLRKSMIDYIKLNYPEDFNDFTESSEFIALIDLIAFFGQSLAFRADLNARENFIDTAERRDSILKLARLVGYNAKRSVAASGFLKIDTVSTTEIVYDSDGQNLSGRVIQWNDVSNENWQEQFNTVINAALLTNQAIGKPSASRMINMIRHDEYNINTNSEILPIYRYDSTVEGQRMTFEAVSASTYNQPYVYESAPDFNRPFTVLYRSDNNGNSSNNTGFFLYFKQGELGYIDFTVDNRVPNNIIDIDVNNINNTDVWLYSLDVNGFTDELWQAVPSVVGQNIIYNSSLEKNLYQINSRTNDKISLVFGDGGFANIPQGNFRLYYRVSNGLSYRITPNDMRSVLVTFQYTSRYNRTETLSVRASLRYTVANAVARETLDDIRQRAPQQYYTQNRMVTGEDYNILPYTTFSSIIKTKAINRTSSGLSRYLDELDTSGKYSSTNIFGDDGVLYRDLYTGTETFTLTNYSDVLKALYDIIIPNILNNRDLLHYYYYSVSPELPLAELITTDKMVNGTQYTISSLGTTNFIQYGAVSNTVGGTFTAENSGTITRSYSVALTANSYLFSGNVVGPDPNISAMAGDTLTFSLSVPGQPFFIKTLPTIGSGNIVTEGTLTNVGQQTGNVVWNTTGVTAGTYYYQSSVNQNYGGNIIITAFGTGTVTTDLKWNLSSVGDSVCTGYFVYNGNPSAVGYSLTNQNRYLVPGAIVRFRAPTGYYFNATNSLVPGIANRAEDTTELYASVMRVSGNGTNNGLGSYSDGTGPVGLSSKIPSGAIVDEIIPLFKNDFNDTLRNYIITSLQAQESFALNYSSSLQSWQILSIAESAGRPWMMRFEYNITTGKYTVSYRALRYVFHSPMNTNFYNEETTSIYDIETNRYVQDHIKILRNNSGPASEVSSLGRDYTFAVHQGIIGTDGYRDPKSVYLTYTDSNNDGVPDNPYVFESVVQPTLQPTTKYVFFETVPSYGSYTQNQIVDSGKIISNYFDLVSIQQQVRNFDLGQVFFVTSTSNFHEITGTATAKTVSAAIQNKFLKYTGRQNLYFQYRHNSPYTNRIDPSISNIIDIYVLTQDYNNNYRRWLSDTTGNIVKPTAPTNTDLAIEFAELNNLKTVSDTIVFNTAVFKPLFGAKAHSSLQAIIKVVKNPAINVSDSEVKASLITAINDYFAIENWEFGETFYFSELSAYLHRELAPNVASVVIVPRDTNQSFGNMYQINCEPYEIIVSAATVDDVEIIPSITAAQLNQSLATT